MDPSLSSSKLGIPGIPSPFCWIQLDTAGYSLLPSLPPRICCPGPVLAAPSLRNPCGRGLPLAQFSWPGFLGLRASSLSSPSLPPPAPFPVLGSRWSSSSLALPLSPSPSLTLSLSSCLSLCLVRDLVISGFPSFPSLPPIAFLSSPCWLPVVFSPLSPSPPFLGLPLS